MSVQVLGPLTVGGVDGIAPRDRIVLSALIVSRNEFVSADLLAEALWGERPPASAAKVVQGCVARLRKQLGTEVIETATHSYRLNIPNDEVDAGRFERLFGRARAQLGDGDPERAEYVVSEALSLWRGRALQDLDDWEPGRDEAERLDALRLDAQELRIEAAIASGRGRQLLEETGAQVTEAPQREHRWALYAHALYQAGRQTEALETLQRARERLLEEFGLDPGAEIVELEQRILHQDPSLDISPRASASEFCPYRGLLPYEADDEEVFFGRETDIEACLTRLRERRLLAVVGASGTGKSSLVRAGLVPVLRREGWHVVVTTPGLNPLESLPGNGAGPRPLLVVDQAEEAVTLSEAAERAAYFQALARYDAPVILTLRADRLADLTAHPAVARLVEQGLYLLSPMGDEHLRAAVEGPARAAGLRLEPGLADLLLREVHGEPGALPLLSHVLRQTWEQREGPTLTVAGYRATGGVRDAVARSAESVYEHLDDVRREQARDLFLRLVMPSDDGEPVRARVARNKLAPDPERERLVEELVAARLLSSDEGDVQLAHEALAREWPRLRHWLDEDVEGQRIFRHLATAAESWEGLGRPVSELYRGVRLAGAKDWADRNASSLTEVERAFLSASDANADAERRRIARSNRRLRLSLGGVAALLAVAIVAGFIAFDERDNARASFTASEAHRLSLQAADAQDLTAALLLAVEANRLQDSRATRDALLATLARDTTLSATLGEVQDGLDEVAVSPDGTRLVVGRPGGDADEAGLFLLDAETGATLATSPSRGYRVRFIDDDTIVAGMDMSIVGFDVDEASSNAPVVLLDGHTLEPLAQQPGEQFGPAHDYAGIGLSADHRYLAASVEGVDDFGQFTEIVAFVWDLKHPAHPVFKRTMDTFGSLFELSPDGRRLYYVPAGGLSIDAYDVRTGKLIARHDYLADTAPDLWGFGDLSPDGSTLALAAGADLILFDAATLTERTRWTSQTGSLKQPTFSDDGKQLATVTTGGDGGFSVWDVASGRQVRSGARFGAGGETWPTFSPDGESLYLSSEGLGLHRFTLSGVGGLMPTLPSEPLGRVAGPGPSPDGRLSAYLSSSGAKPGNFMAQVQDMTTGKIIATVQFPKDDGLNSSEWSLDSKNLAFTEGTKILVWHADGSLTESVDLGVGHVNQAPWMGHDRILVIGAEGRLATVDAATLKDVQPLSDLKTPLSGGAASSDGRWVIVSTAELQAKLVDARTGKSTDLPGEIWYHAFSPDGSLVALVDTDEGGGLYDPAKREWVHRWEPGTANFPIIWDPDRTGWFYTATETKVTLLRPDGTPYASAPSVVSWLAPHPQADGDQVVLADSSGALYSWRASLKSWIEQACALAGRNLTSEEWRSLVGDAPYHQTCQQFPSGA